MKKYKFYLGALIFSSFVYTQTFNVDLEQIKTGLEIQGDEYNSLGTARSAAMAGSMGALGGDLSAMTTNPAGGAVFLKNNIALTGTISSYNTKTDFENNKYSNSDTNFSLNQVGGILVFDLNDKWKNFNIGFNYLQKKLDQSILFAENKDVQYPELVDPVKNSYDLEFYTFGGYDKITTGYKSKFTLNLSSNYDNKFYIGANLNFHNSSTTKTERLIEYETDNQKLSYESFAANTPYTENTNGFSFDIGAIGKINQMVRVGLSYQSPVWNGNTTQDYNYSDDEVINQYDSNGNPLLFKYSLDNSILNAYYDKIKVRTPGKLTASGALVISKNLALNLDYSLKFNKNLNIKDSNFSTYNDTNSFISDYLKNSSEVKFGGEYRYDNWRFRAGYAFSESPVKKDIYIDSSIHKTPFNNVIQGNSNLLSTGIGYNFGGFTIDFAYQNRSTEYYTTFGGEYYNLNDRENQYGALYGDVFNTNETYVAKVKDIFNNYILTLGWTF